MTMQQHMIEQWGLQHNLFVSSPPEASCLERVFTGRESEVERSLDTVTGAPRRLLVTGLFGVGKTVLLREVHRKFRAARNYGVFIEERMYASDPTLAHVILRGLASSLAALDSYAAQIHERLAGVKSTHTAEREDSIMLGSGLPAFASEIASTVSEGTAHTMDELPDLAAAIHRLLELARQKFEDRRIIMSIDDLDKRDPNTVRELLMGARDLLHNPKCSYIFTGHPLGILRDAYSTAGGIIDQEVVVPVMHPDMLRLMMARYLGAGRATKWWAWDREPRFSKRDVEDQDLVPFTIESAGEIINRSYGIPRVFNIYCFNVLQEAAMQRVRTIDVDHLQMCWDRRRHQLRNSVRPDLRNMLEVLTEQISPLDIERLPDELYDRLGIDTRDELMRQLDYALKNDLLVMRGDRHLIVSPIVEQFEIVGPTDHPPSPGGVNAEDEPDEDDAS